MLSWSELHVFLFLKSVARFLRFFQIAGARGWDMATPQHFHHGEKELWGACGVGPDTGWTGQQRKVIGVEWVHPQPLTNSFEWPVLWWNCKRQWQVSFVAHLWLLTAVAAPVTCHWALIWTGQRVRWNLESDSWWSERYALLLRTLLEWCLCSTAVSWLIWRYGLPDWDLAVKAVQESHTRRVWRWMVLGHHL